MTDVPIPIPDNVIPILSPAIARRMGIAEPPTNPGKIAMFQAFVKAECKQAISDYLAQQAARQARDNPPAEVTSW